MLIIFGSVTSEQSRAGICNFVSNENDDRLDHLWEIDYDGNEAEHLMR